MIVHNVKLEQVAGSKKQYPTLNYPEISFVGRSNVGKSSLINSMIYRKALARTSSNPGKTQTINFYNVEDELFFVDLPGYGYARVSQMDRERWGKMIEEYLYNRPQLKCVVQLIDIRHEPTKLDIQMFEWIKHFHDKIIVVATKMDKLSKNQVQKNLAAIRKGLQMEKDHVLIGFSSETKQGRDELWGVFEDILGQDKE